MVAIICRDFFKTLRKYLIRTPESTTVFVSDRFRKMKIITIETRLTRDANEIGLVLIDALYFFEREKKYQLN